MTSPKTERGMVGQWVVGSGQWTVGSGGVRGEEVSECAFLRFNFALDCSF